MLNLIRLWDIQSMIKQPSKIIIEMVLLRKLLKVNLENLGLKLQEIEMVDLMQKIKEMYLVLKIK